MHSEHSEIEQTRGETNQLSKFCLTEIDRQLKNIEKFFVAFKNNPKDDQLLLNMLNTTQTIEDFAMVYGYGGVELLACNLSSAIASIASRNKTISEDFLDKLDIAIDAMRSMSGIDDEQKIDSIVNKTIAKIKGEDIQPPPSDKNHDEKVKDGTTEDELNFHDDLNAFDEFSEPEGQVQFSEPAQSFEPSKPVFDIKESDSLIDLIAKIEKNNEITNHTTLAQSQLSEAALKVQGNQVKEIEQVFNDIFIEETVENLNFLVDAIEMVNSGESLGESIMRIKEACSSLKDSASCFNIKSVQNILSLLSQLVRDKLTFNKKPSSQVLAAILQAEKAIRNYVKSRDNNFDQAIATLNSAIKSNDDTPPTPPQEEKIQIVNDFSATEDFKKRKVKVVFDKDDMDRRWISKFK